jgi:hypothetical protein
MVSRKHGKIYANHFPVIPANEGVECLRNDNLEGIFVYFASFFVRILKGVVLLKENFRNK